MTYLISVLSVYTKLETLSISPVFVLLQSLQEDIVYGLLFCTCLCRVITYGLENKDADFTAENITYNDLGCGTFDAVVQGEVKGHFHHDHQQ